MKLKKIIFIFLTSVFIAIPVKADVPTITKADYYNVRQGIKGKWYGALWYTTIDGKYLFSVENYSVIGNSYDINNSYFNQYSKEKLDYIKLISNVSYDEIKNHNHNYFMAAQELIWNKTIGIENITWTTRAYGRGFDVNIEKYKIEIMEKVAACLNKPSFDNVTISGYMNDVLELEDKNNVLNYYEVVNNGNNIVWITNNKLYVKIMSDKLETIKLKRIIGEGDAIYYYSKGNEDLAYLNSEVVVESELYVEPGVEYIEFVNVNFVDSEKKSLINEEIKFEVTNTETEEVVLEQVTYNGISQFELKEGVYELDVTNGFSSNEDKLITIESGKVYNYSSVNLELNKTNEEKALEKIETAPTVNESKVINDNSTNQKIGLEELPNTVNYTTKYKLIILVLLFITIMMPRKQDEK